MSLLRVVLGTQVYWQEPGELPALQSEERSEGTWTLGPSVGRDWYGRQRELEVRGGGGRDQARGHTEGWDRGKRCWF